MQYGNNVFAFASTELNSMLAACILFETWEIVLMMVMVMVMVMVMMVIMIIVDEKL